MNIWRRFPLDINPYRRTAFRICGISREVVSHPDLVQMLGQTRSVIDARQHFVAGQPVSLVDMNAAEPVLLDARQRIAEELLEHAVEKLPLAPIKKLAREAAAAMAQGNAGPLALENPGVLRGWALALVRQFIAANPGPDPSFGALELDLAPPFGREKEDD